jgi:hypothetical protein
MVGFITPEAVAAGVVTVPVAESVCESVAATVTAGVVIAPAADSVCEAVAATVTAGVVIAPVAPGTIFAPSSASGAAASGAKPSIC